jgi:hypothetical protein
MRVEPVSHPGLHGRSWVTPHELAVLVFLLPPRGRFLEIGSASGATAAAVLLRRPHATALCLDLFRDFTDDYPGEGGELHRSHWHANAALVPGRMRLREVTSEQLLASGTDGGFDLVLVDGDHADDWPRRDLACARELCPGGPLVVHDYADDRWPWIADQVGAFCASFGYRVAARTGNLAVLARPGGAGVRR